MVAVGGPVPASLRSRRLGLPMRVRACLRVRLLRVLCLCARVYLLCCGPLQALGTHSIFAECLLAFDMTCRLAICVLFHIMFCECVGFGVPLAAPLATTVAEQFPEASQVMVGDALRAALLAEGVPLAEASCVRDYSVPCPVDWVDAGDGGTCLAPNAYAGPCGESIDYRGLSVHEKMLTASRCGAAFPCVDGCTHDYSVVCPVGWSESVGGCEAPADYTGPCVGKKNFGFVNSAGKSMFASACAVQWPCRQPRASASLGVGDRQCVADLAAACPEGWVLRGLVCHAPQDYAGPCPIALEFGKYTDSEKSIFAKECIAHWPCRG